MPSMYALIGKIRTSLSLPLMWDAIARGRPLIAGFGERLETRPVGGRGLGADA